MEPAEKPSRARRFLFAAVRWTALAAVLIGIGWGLELCRSSRLAVWVAREGGTFTADEIKVPEAAGFDTSDSIPIYWNVARFERRGVTYVLAHYYRSWEDLHNRPKSMSTDVCFVVLPGPDLAPVRLSSARMPSDVPLAAPDPVQGFPERWHASLLSGFPSPPPEALGRLLPPAVQQELLAAGDLLTGFVAVGRIVRLDTIKSYTVPPYDRLLAIAERCAAAWRR